MLPRTINRLPGRTLLLVGILLALTAWQPARAAEVKDESLALVPGDAAFYAASLRNKEQFERITRSNAYKAILALPFIKNAFDKAAAEPGKPDNPIAMYQKFIEDKDNKELVDLLLDGLSHETFFYGGKGWIDFFTLYTKIRSEIGLAAAVAADGNPAETNRVMIRSTLSTLQKNHKLLTPPDFVLGFKVQSPKKVSAQLDRLEKLAAAMIQNAPPLKDKFKRVKAGGGDFLTLELDGSLIPWDHVPLQAFEDNKGEYDDLVKHVKKSKLTLSIGVKAGFLLIGVGPTLADLQKFGGQGKSLADLDDVKPLKKHAKKPIISVAYLSKTLMKSIVDAGMADYGTVAKMAKDGLKGAELPEKLKKSLEKDIDKLMESLTQITEVTGGTLSFSYLTDTGYESFSYAHGQGPRYKNVACHLQNHFGGAPILAFAVGGHVDGSLYGGAVKWIKTLYGHAETYYLQTADDDAKVEYKKITAAVLPLFKRLDEITTAELIPSLKQSGLGLVIDAKWTSKQWHKEMPETAKALPMPELGLLLGLSDEKKFTTALSEYRKTLNELYEKIREAAPNKEVLPEFKISKLPAKKVAGGALYPLPIPVEVGLDKQVRPVLAVGKTVALAALSEKHAERLLAPTPLKGKTGPLAREGKLVSVLVLDWPALVDAALPWVEFGIEASMDLDKDRKKLILEQVRSGVEILKVFKRMSSVTYVEGEALVTHGEMVFKDLAKKE